MIRAIGQSLDLRDLDWRFLVPRPPTGRFPHLVLLGGSVALAESILGIGLARRVSRHVLRSRDADAVIMLHTARTSVEEAIGCLRRGGAFYGEIERGERWSFATMPGAIRRSLQRAGMAHTTIYWVAPNFEKHEIYLPVDAQEVLRWYWATISPAETLGQRVLSVSGRLLAKRGTYPQVNFVRRFAVTAVAGPVEDAVPAILGAVALPEMGRLSDLSLALLTPGKTDRGGVVALPFASGHPAPLAVIKTRRRAKENARIEREQAATRGGARGGRARVGGATKAGRVGTG